jgi:hypothetical protein
MRSLTIILFLSFIASFKTVQSQDQQATSASDIQTFFLSDNEIGQIENSANLFTGEVNLPISLINIPGRGGLTAGVGLIYNSNVEEIVNTWNVEAPTGILGLGWSIDIPKIVVDNKMTGTREDDEYYLVEGGMSNRLYCVNINGGIRAYEPEQYSKWSINFDSSDERWTIVKEDGMTYIYGDDDLNYGSAVEYVLHWGNWIGTSSNYSSSKTKRQGLVWNLAKIVNRWGDAVTFDYKKVERFIKNGTGIRHTEASYLKKITDPLGRTINFIDMPKEAREYQDPHTEVAETDNSDGTGGATGDAYQERYEKRYLGNIEVKDTDNTLLYSFQFVYDVPNDGNLTKRMLTAIVQKNKDGATFPSIDFSYKTAGNKRGALEKVTYPKGGEVIYHYNETGIELAYSDRDFTVTAPSGYAEPQVWIGNDYIVVAWRNSISHETTGKTVKLSVFTWDGKWNELFRQTIGPVELYPHTMGSSLYKNFQVGLGDDYFAVLTHDSDGTGDLFLTHKDPGSTNGWKMTNINNIRVGTDYEDDSSIGDPLLLTGNDFVAIGKSYDNASYNNGVIYTYNWDGEDWREEIIKSIATGQYYGTGTNNYIIYHDEDGISGGYQDYIYFFYQNEIGEWVEKPVSSSYYFWSSDHSYWYPSNSFAVVMAHNNNEFIYMWDENYNFTNKFDVLGAYSDRSQVRILNNSMVALAPTNPSKAKVTRYDGVSWLTTSELVSDYNSLAGNYFSFSEDIIFWPDNNQDLQSKRFNANSGSWVNSLYVNGYSNLLYSGQNHIYYDQGIYTRNWDETWNSTPEYTLSHDPGFPYFRSNGQILIAYTNSNDTYVVWIKNGEVSQDENVEVLSGKSIEYFSSKVKTPNLIGGNSIVTYPGSFSYMEDATQITLHRFITNGVTGKITEYPVEGIEINSGSDNKYISIAYDANHGVYNELAKGAMYNKATVTHKNNSTSQGPYGSAEHYFINGLSSTESAVAFPAGGNASIYYKLLKGQQYLKRVIEGTSTVVSEEKTSWEVTMRDIVNSSSHQIGRAYFVRPDKTEVTVNNITDTQYFTYDSYGNLTYKSSTNSEGKVLAEDYYYLHEITAAAYDFAEAENLYGSVVLTKRLVGGVTMDASAVRWSTGKTVNYPEETYVWERTGSSDFNFTTPTTDWKKLSTVTQLDNYGNVIEVRDDVNDTYSAKIMGYDHSLPVGIVNNSTRAKSFVEVFDDETLSKWIGAENGDGDTQWSVEDDQLKLINYASATDGECDRIYLDLGAEVSNEVVFEFDLKIANSDNWDLTIGLGGSSWTTGNGGTENAVWTSINNEVWRYYSGGWYDIKWGLVVGKTYHFKIVAKPQESKADFYVDGIKCVSNGNFRYSSSGIQKAAFGNYGYGTVTTTWYIDNVRLYPQKASIVSFDYIPHIGKTSETDINNNRLTYSYDLFNRLETVRDGEGNILEHTNYSLRGNDVAAYLDATPSVIDLSASSGESGFSISSNVDWVAGVSEGDDSWLSIIGPNYGNGNGSIYLDYTQNTTGSTRSAVVTLQGEGLTEPVYIDQASSTGSISANVSSLYFYYGTMSRTFTIFSDTNWTISKIYLDGSGWLSVSPSSGSGDAVIHVTCTAPYSGQTWSAQLKAQTTGGAYVIINVTFDDSEW